MAYLNILQKDLGVMFYCLSEDNKWTNNKCGVRIKYILTFSPGFFFLGSDPHIGRHPLGQFSRKIKNVWSLCSLE